MKQGKRYWVEQIEYAISQIEYTSTVKDIFLNHGCHSNSLYGLSIGELQDLWNDLYLVEVELKD